MNALVRKQPTRRSLKTTMSNRGKSQDQEKQRVKEKNVNPAKQKVVL